MEEVKGELVGRAGHWEIKKTLIKVMLNKADVAVAARLGISSECSHSCSILAILWLSASLCSAHESSFLDGANALLFKHHRRHQQSGLDGSWCCIAPSLQN